MSGVKFNVGVVNYGGLPSGGSGLLAARPAAGVVGRIFIASDTLLLYRDTGAAWTTIGGGGGITGSGAAGQATFWTGASAISGDNTFFWDNTNKRLGLGTTTPGVRLDVHSTNVIAQFNGTGTSNSYLDFQNAGVTQYRIGNNYNAGSRLFQLFDQISATTLLTINISNAWGIGVLPSVWQTMQGLQVGEVGSIGSKRFAAGNSQTVMGNNMYYTNTGFRYITSDYAAMIRMVGNELQFNLANTGIADALITFSQPFTISSSGFVGIGYTSPAYNLAIQGNVLINTNTANALYELFVNGNIYTGGISPTNSTVAVNTAMTRTQTGYVCTATLTLTLPTVSGLNNIYFVVANTGATVTVQRAGSDTILDKTGTSQTSVTVAAGTRSMFYCGGGSITYQIF